MIRLRPTSISVSQSDVSFHLGQLDIYQGLLKQGFKKQDIIRYFKEQDALDVDSSQENLGLPQSGRAASTIELTAPTQDAVPGTDSVGDRDACVETTVSENEPSDQTGRTSDMTISSANKHLAAPFSPEEDSATLDSEYDSRTVVATCRKSRGHIPRQSSLLRFAHLPESSSPDSDNGAIKTHSISSRSSTKYRPRSRTYSHDLPEADEQDFHQHGEDGLDVGMQHLTVDGASATKAAQLATSSSSSLRPQAEEFLPLRLSAPAATSIDPPRSQASLSSPSIPSSPPDGFRTLTHEFTRRLSIPCTEPLQLFRQLDSSFAVYDDSLPPDVQPRTPDDVDRHCHFNPAYTAPPGSLSVQRIVHSRQAGVRSYSGDQSPTTRAMIVRGRRQREFDRSTRIERLRIARMRQHDRIHATSPDDGREPGYVNVDYDDPWRDDLDADRVGEENFDDGHARPSLVRATNIRVINDAPRM